MARLLVPILSDVHFEKSNPISSRTPSIADAITSVDESINDFLILLPGDLAWAGTDADFEIVRNFLHSLRQRILDRRPQAVVQFAATPGNHDCFLPQEAAQNRKSKVESSIETLKTSTPDQYFVADVLAAQDNFWKFAKGEILNYKEDPLDRLCSSVLYEASGNRIQLNFLNSAALSQHTEIVGGLFLPTELAKSKLTPDPSAQLIITVMHHWSSWIDPNNAIALRQVLSGRTDMLITGHQHYSFAYDQKQEDDITLAFYESPALYDKTRPTSGSFRVLTIDLNAMQVSDRIFKWKDRIYRPNPPVDEPSWKPIIINRSARETYNISPMYLRKLSDPGVAYVQSSKDETTLSQLFVYPDIRNKDSDNGPPSLIRGSRVLSALASEKVVLIQGAALSGKSALSKALYLDLTTQTNRVVIKLDGRKLDDLSTDQLRALIGKSLEEQYSKPDKDRYFQLAAKERAIIIDDWHLARLSEVQRTAIYRWLDGFAKPSILFVDELFQIKSIASANQDQSLDGSEVDLLELSITGLSNVSRGQLITNWQRLRQGSSNIPAEVSKEVKQYEDLISHRLSKDSLPPYGFFILCMLQAAENNSIDSTAGGSFGHLYEVLVTTALSKGILQDTLLTQKFALLEEMAADLWKSGSQVLSRARIDEIAAKYLDEKLLSLPVQTLIDDLIDARVLIPSENHFKFAYEHFYFYFVARYIRNHLDSEEADQLKEKIDLMIDTISSSENSTIIMFLIYFASERRHIISRLTANAGKIYSEVDEARMEDDTRIFVLPEQLHLAPKIEENPDVAENRKRERQRRDEDAEKEGNKPSNLHLEAFSYGPEISDIRKLHLSEKNIEALGQVVRNFTTTLPGELKILVIKTIYKLGLRSMGRMFQMIASGLQFTAEKMKNDAEAEGCDVNSKESRDAFALLQNLLLMLSKVVAIHFCNQISISVGVADMELAYSKTLKELDESAALKLVDLTIKMEHSRTFPEAEVRTVYQSLDHNPFAQAVCRWLAAAHLLMNKSDRLTRQRMANLLNFDPKKFELAVAQATGIQHGR